MKELSTFQKQTSTANVFRGFLFVIIICLLFGCNGESSFKAESETASVSFSLEWHGISDLQPPGKVLSKAQVDCSLIDTIECEVYDASGNDLTTATFACAAKEGTVAGIQVGSNIAFVVLGWGDGDILYHGEIPGVTISAGQTNDLGVIDVYPFFVSDEDRSPVDTASLAAGELSFQWTEVENASQYNVVISTDENFNTTTVDALTANTAFTPSGPLGSGTYYWMVVPVDTHLNYGADSSIWSFTVISGGACSYSISPTGNSFSSGAGTGTVSVTPSADDCTWSASTTADWVTITSGASGSGNGAVAYSVSANTSEAQRSATVTIAGQAHTITQAGTGLLPDLTITSNNIWSWIWSIQPSEVVQGETVTFAGWKTTNQGGADAGAFNNGFYLSTDAVITTEDTYLAENSNAGLAPGGESIWNETTVTIPEDTASGAYYIGILADSRGEVTESDETNNYLSTQIAVGKPDLVISSGRPTVEPSSVAPGESVTIEGWTVKNQGEVSADAFHNSYYLSTDEVIDTNDDLIGGAPNDSLSAGEETSRSAQTLRIPSNTNPGSYYIGILADSRGEVTESDETNNYVYSRRKITVKEGGGNVGDCEFDISPSSGVNVGPDGYKGAISVYASEEDCNWTASANAGWITIQSGSSGTGDGEVIYSVSGNGTEQERSGAISVAGYTFTIWQSY